MKFTFFVFWWLMLLATNSFADVNSTSLELSYTGAYKYKVHVKFENRSDKAQCVRDVDMQFRNIGDFLAAEDEKNSPLKFIGSPDNSKALMMPDAYAIIPPGLYLTGVFYLNKSYKPKGKSASLTYVLPIIPCEILLTKGVRIPPLSRLKDHAATLKNIQIEYFKDGYPEWVQNGALLTSNTLKINF